MKTYKGLFTFRKNSLSLHKKILLNYLCLLILTCGLVSIMYLQSPIPLVTEPGLLSSVSDSNSGYMKAGNRPLLHFVESWQENQSFPVYRFLSLHCRHPTL